MNQDAAEKPDTDHPEQPNPGKPGFAGQPPTGQPGQGELNPELLPPKEGEQRPD